MSVQTDVNFSLHLSARRFPAEPHLKQCFLILKLEVSCRLSLLGSSVLDMELLQDGSGSAAAYCRFVWLV